MTHLDETELVDLLEGRLVSVRAEHADDCDTCRQRLAGLRAALSEARDVPGGEPSPLFWQHFAARVSDAVRTETPAAATPGWMAWMRSPAAAWATSASIAVLLMVTALWRATLLAPVPRAARVSPAAPIAGPAAQPDEADADSAWSLVRSAADGLAWDDAVEAGIVPHPGSAEGVALELTADERAELARLVQAEMKHTGAS